MMHYMSTRNSLLSLSLAEAIQAGLAPDGGLFLPQFLPIIEKQEDLADLTYAEFAFNILKDFFATDYLASSLKSICEQTFTFPVPSYQLDENTLVLELFHGPTCSFKDFGARFLAEYLNLLKTDKQTILVATSGDTGSAVASAFYRKTNYQVIILYPQGKVSAKQEQQMTCWDENIIALAVNGNFDQCQRLVKLAFQDAECQSIANLTSANSINIGRLLPQLTYYAYSSLQFYKQKGLKAGFIIPSGNLGNATAAYWAKAMGFPIREIVLATNANRVLENYLDDGRYTPRSSIKTLANAMDVGNPSNFERLSQLFASFADFKKEVTAVAVDDEAICNTIKRIYDEYRYICCPHTATAFHVLSLLDNQPWIVVATADPCKFDDLIEPIIKQKTPVAPALQKLLNKQQHMIHVEANLGAIKEFLHVGNP